MLSYLLRTLPVWLRARRHRGAPALISRYRGRVPLGRIDLNLHLNQAAYAEQFELGRVDWVMRSGFWPGLRASSPPLNAVVAEQQLVYRRELKPRQRFEIDTRAVGMDGRLLVLEQHILVGRRVHARARVKLIFVGPEGVLSAEAAQQRVGAICTDALAVEDWQLSG